MRLKWPFPAYAPAQQVVQAKDGQALKVAPLVTGAPLEAELTPSGSGGLGGHLVPVPIFANLPTIVFCHDVALSLGDAGVFYW